jgi:hypothetical protein
MLKGLVIMKDNLESTNVWQVGSNMANLLQSQTLGLWSGLFLARNESGDITQKYSEILQERQQYNRDIAEI